MEEHIIYMYFFCIGMSFEKLEQSLQTQRLKVWKMTDQKVFITYSAHLLISVLCMSWELTSHSFCTYSPCVERKTTQHKPKRSLHSYQMGLITDIVKFKRKKNQLFTWCKSQYLYIFKLMPDPSGKTLIS